MARYKLIGRRFLRKYTAPKTTPVYSASVDAQKIVDSLCDVPWEKVDEREPTMTYHTEENVGTEEDKISGLDMNVRIRNEFDAALFCAQHVGGQHRAYANAAVYRYDLPDEAIGTTLESVRLSVTSDPYNANGARIHVMTNSTGVIPTNCHDCRGEDASGEVVEDGTTASRVAVRTARTDSGTEYWYPTTEPCTISPTGGLELQRYLFVFVLMESYSTVRGNWLEGCSFILNLVEIETSAAVTGWTDGGTIDLSHPTSGAVFPIAAGGIVPGIAAAAPSGLLSGLVRADANLVIEDGGSQAPSRSAAGALAAAAVGRLYESLYAGRVDVEKTDGTTFQPGALFNVTRRTEEHVSLEYDRPTETDVLALESSVLLIPFAVPCAFTPSKVNLSFDELAMSVGARFNVFLADGYLLSLSDEQLRDPGLYDLRSPPFSLLGTIEGGEAASFDVNLAGKRVATLVIAGWLPPDAYDVVTGGAQGTGSTPFMPDVTISE